MDPMDSTTLVASANSVKLFLAQLEFIYKFALTILLINIGGKN